MIRRGKDPVRIPEHEDHGERAKEQRHHRGKQRDEGPDQKLPDLLDFFLQFRRQ